jgi:hypothetical protein
MKIRRQNGLSVRNDDLLLILSYYIFKLSFSAAILSAPDMKTDIFFSGMPKLFSFWFMHTDLFLPGVARGLDFVG